MTPNKILSALKKTSVRYESGYHGNSSIGAEANEYHFRTSNTSKHSFHTNEKERIEQELNKIGAQYRFSGTTIFVKQ